MTKVEIISNTMLPALQEKVNSFIYDKDIKSITFHVTETRFVAFIVYEEE